jgi:hypothetical protein
MLDMVLFSLMLIALIPKSTNKKMIEPKLAFDPYLLIRKGYFGLSISYILQLLVERKGAHKHRPMKYFFHWLDIGLPNRLEVGQPSILLRRNPLELIQSHIFYSFGTQGLIPLNKPIFLEPLRTIPPLYLPPCIWWRKTQL